jgi:uncharacterized membrane protein YccC
VPELLDTALHKNAAYLRAILEEYRRSPTADDLPYRIARRAAHRADNALVIAWRDMLSEPLKKREIMDRAFDLTFLNHALLSYISAFGAHRYQQKDAGVPALSDEVLLVLDAASESLKSEKPGENQTAEQLLEKIREAGRNAGQEFTQLQFTLLYNIAEVTNKILQLSPKVRALR